ncbi:hexameric tyrosine-coordinated heme protein [Pseudomonas sp. 31-12]|uniref:hexameric tyrosine-coordinated heme protein n=1 Tax=Pseudomonas sp. 31-12 TaxID=2201356 RepID=UPI001C447A1E
MILPTAEAGRQLAINVARLSIKVNKLDDAVRSRLRPSSIAGDDLSWRAFSAN